MMLTGIATSLREAGVLGSVERTSEAAQLGNWHAHGGRNA